MNYLFLDTSKNEILGQTGSEAGFKPHAWNTNRDLANRITAFCDEMLAEAGLRLTDIHLFAIGTGPGSLTGLRVGLAFFRTLAQVHQKPLIGIDLFSWSAATLEGRGATGHRHLITQAFLGHYFHQVVDVGNPSSAASQAAAGSRSVAVQPPTLLKEQELAADHPVLALRGDIKGVERFDPDRESLHRLLVPHLTDQADFDHLLHVKPLYIVPSQPELKLEKRI